MIAHGFTVSQMVELVRAGLATAASERVAPEAIPPKSRGCEPRRQGGGRSRKATFEHAGMSNPPHLPINERLEAPLKASSIQDFFRYLVLLWERGYAPRDNRHDK